jgi:putative ABC transport system permease protein
MPLENWLYKLPLRLRSLFRRGRVEQDLSDELADHLARETAARMRHGATRDEATRAARMALGGIEQQKEAVRDTRGLKPLEDFAADLRYSFRSLRRNPGFTAAAVLVLGLGLGASTAVFSVVDAVLLSQLPYPEADRLIRVFQKNSPTNLWTLSVVDVQAIAGQQKSFAAFGAARWQAAALSGVGTPEQIPVGRVTSGFFQAIGIAPALGRLLQPGDDAPGAPPVAVVSHGFAERVLGGSAQALGKAITLDGLSHTVVGILPPGRDELAGIPAVAWPVLQLTPPTRRGPFGLWGYARLKPGVTLEAAVQDLAGISERIFPLWAAGFQDKTARLTPVPLRTTIVGTADRSIGYFAGAVALVLLIAIANVGTLMLVRTSAREQELSVRGALGAARPRLARLVLTECLSLAFLAGVAGLAIAAAGVGLVAATAPNLPRLAEIGLDARAAGFLSVIALLSAVLVSLSPVAQVLRRASGSSLAPDARRAGTSRSSNRTRAAFVIAEFALALPLLLGAGLLLKSFLKLQQVDPGFDPIGVGTVNLGLPAVRYPNDTVRMVFWNQILQRVAETPGVLAAGISTTLPPNNGGDVNNFDLIAHPVAPGGNQPVAPWAWVSNGYFTAMGIPLLEGRLFTPADSAAAPPVVVVSRAWAQRYFPGEPVLGQQLIEGGCTECPRTTIVGVVGDVHYLGLDTPAEGVYAPLVQTSVRGASLVFRSRGAPGTLFSALRTKVAALDPELPFAGSLLRDALEASLADPRRWTAVLSAFAAVALLLAGLGIFGLMSYVVRQRRREIGVRIALGAQPGDVTRMIVARGMRYALLGTTIGLALAAVQMRWLRALLFQVAPSDPVAVLGGAGVLLLAGFLACWLPGRRAARIRALEAISTE